MKQLPGICLLLALSVCWARAADESIDRLLNKLPPPTKLVDPAISDPLTKQINTAIQSHNFGVALDLSRRLAARYPKSLSSQMVHAGLAASIREFREATRAYNAALALRPDFPPAYIGLAIVNASQNRFDVALSDFQHITRALPQADIGWIGSSACAEKLGRMKDSLAFARKATAVAPSSAGAWLQAAHEESLAGNAPASKADLAQATELRRNAPKAKTN
jgi:tetratricopeptide (TPR) repeat protein